MRKKEGKRRVQEAKSSTEQRFFAARAFIFLSALAKMSILKLFSPKDSCHPIRQCIASENVQKKLYSYIENCLLRFGTI